MKATKPVAPIHGRMVEQIPAFAAIGVIGYFVDSGITLSAPNMSACRQSSPGPRLHHRDDRQFRPQSGDYVPPLARARLARLPAVLRRGLGRGRDQLRRLFDLRHFGSPPGDRRHAAILPLFIAAGSGDGSDVRWLSVLRLWSLGIVDSGAQSASTQS